MTTPFCRTRLASAVAGIVLALGAGGALATGFQLNEQSASSLGNAFAGGAAFTDDASAMWWNPAALSQFKRGQAIGALHIVTPEIKFRNDGSAAALNQPLGGDGGDAGNANFIPNAYVSVPINPQWTFGLGINAPFGLTTHYGEGWIGRFQALKSSIMTVNVNPALSWQVSKEFAFGFGASYEYLRATLTQNVNYSGAIASAAQSFALAGQIPPGKVLPIIGATPGLESKATVKGDDGGWGWNIGVAWDVTPQFRLGAGYRSEVDLKVSGNQTLENPIVTVPPGTAPDVAAYVATISAYLNANVLYNKGVTSDITLPQIANLSMLYRIDPKWEVMADVQWTGWSSVPKLQFDPTNGTAPSVVPLNWDDTYKIAVGASYRYDDKWKARFGVAFDQTPANDVDTTVRLPDSDRWWIALGGEYRYSKDLKFDAGFVYIFADSPSFNQNQGSTAANGLVKGSFDASTTIFSMQATYSF
jgi:long-chain fatty acid transport protein